METTTKKLKTYTFTYFESDEVVEAFRALRKKIYIPVDGFDPPEVFSGMDVFGPELWVKILQRKGEAQFDETFNKIDTGLARICKNFKYEYPHQTARFFFFYNQIIFTDRKFENKGNFRVTSVHSISTLIKNPRNKSLMQKDKLPILIKVSPFLTQNDLIGLIKSHWDEIEYLGSLYTAEKVRGRGRITLERDNFIYKHRSLPRKEISKLVSGKFGASLDEIQIRKIISRQKQTRARRDNK